MKDQLHFDKPQMEGHWETNRLLVFHFSQLFCSYDSVHFM